MSKEQHAQLDYKKKPCPQNRSPESSRRVVHRTGEPSRRLRSQVGRQRGHRLGVARIVGELDRDRLGGPLRNGTVQLLDGLLRLGALVKPDEADALGKTCREKEGGCATLDI